MVDIHKKQNETELVSKILANLDARISRIEERLNLNPIGFNTESKAIIPGPDHPEKEPLELQIGLYWFAKVGIAALMTGTIFLLLQPYSTLHPAFSTILGYFLGGSVITVSRYLRKSSLLLSGYLLGSGLLLFFFASLRLHYFSDRPVIIGDIPETILLSVIVGASLIVSLRWKSIYLTAVSLTMGCATALTSKESFFIIISIVVLLTVYITLKEKWYNLITYGIALTYLTYFIWSINDPLVGNVLELRSVSFGGAIFVLFLTVILGSTMFFRERDSKENISVIVASLLNGILGYGLFTLITLLKFQGVLALSHFLASGVFLFMAAAFWIREKSRFQTFFYAMTGYAALSFAIIARFSTPDSFIWLCWQSLLVVSTAVWFRSKFIIVTNFIIYTTIFIAYIALAGRVSATSLSFGVVALLSARVLSWQRNRLELKTDKMRTAYLVAAFVIFPYALYQILPAGYVSLSWLGVALIYYVISRVLKNVKYRWMALLTFLMTALYLLVIGIIRLEPILRIISFLVLGIVLLVISFIYGKAKMKSGLKED